MNLLDTLKSFFEKVKYWVLSKTPINLIKINQKNIEKLAKIKKEISEIIESNNPIQLMATFSLARNFLRKDYLETMGSDQPHLHLLAGLSLKIGVKSKNSVKPITTINLQGLLSDYSYCYSSKLLFENLMGRAKNKKADIKFTAQQQKIIEQINPNAYEFQIVDYLKNVFGQMDEFFLKEFGFTVQDALNFEKKILEYYFKRAEQRVEAAKNIMEKEKGKGSFEKIKSQKKKEQEILLYWFYLLSKDSEKIFLFSEKDLIEENGDLDFKKLAPYLKHLSCNLGNCNANYNDYLDENEIILKPFIRDGDQYFCPIPQELLCNLPKIFENLVKQKKESQPEVFERLNYLKKEYLEKRSSDYFSRVFPRENVFRNLIYYHNGQKFEIDTLVLYDTNVLITECKSGGFFEPNQKVKTRTLERDLNSLIGKAYEQTSRVREYLKSDKNPILEFSNGEKFLKLNQKVEFDYHLINVTLAPLMHLGSNLGNLKVLDLLPDEETLWSVNIFELDLITKHLSIPSVFIHFLKKRLEQQSENIFHAYDETSFFSFYLKTGGFIVPEKDGEKINYVGLDSDWSAGFDAHYLRGDNPPKLEIDEKFLEFILEIQESKISGFSEIILLLLELNLETRKNVIQKINEVNSRTLSDHKDHDMSCHLPSWGLTFMARWKIIDKKLEAFCLHKKYVAKAERWVGFENDCSQGKKYFTKFFYVQEPWVVDEAYDKILKETQR